MNKHWYLKQRNKLQSSKMLAAFWTFFGIHIVYLYIIAGLVVIAVPSMRYRGLLVAVTALFTKTVIVKLVAHIFPRKRPYQEHGFRPVGSGLFSKIDAEPDSFPSGHTASISAAFIIILFYFPVLALVSLPFFIMTIIGRLILGYHYITDLLGGLIVGVSIGLLTLILFK